MRIIFMGTPEFAVPTLNALVQAGHHVVAVYSQPPRRAGRGKLLTPSPVQARAEDLEIPTLHPVSLRTAEAQAEFAAFDADVAVVAAYGLILPQAILDAPRRGCLNVHGSLLPRWRGAAPIQRGILAGDTFGGVTIMQMEAGLDTGPMLAMADTKLAGKTAGDATAEIAYMGARLMADVLDELDEFEAVPQPEEGVSYAAKIDKAEARLDFTRTADLVLRQVLAFNPAPGAFFEFEGDRYRVLAAELASPPTQPSPLKEGGLVLDDKLTIACAQGAIRPTLIQRAGKPAMATADLLRGRPIPAGTRLA